MPLRCGKNVVRFPTREDAAKEPDKRIPIGLLNRPPGQEEGDLVLVLRKFAAVFIGRIDGLAIEGDSDPGRL